MEWFKISDDGRARAVGGNRRGISKDSFFGIDMRRKKIFHGEIDDSESARSFFLAFIIIFSSSSPSRRLEYTQGLLLTHRLYFSTHSSEEELKQWKKIIQIVFMLIVSSLMPWSSSSCFEGKKLIEIGQRKVRKTKFFRNDVDSK